MRKTAKVLGPKGVPHAGRWVIYLRQSKKRRDSFGEVTTTSLEVQEEACRARIKLLDPNAVSIEVIIDHGRSGRRGGKRPGRDELLARARAREVDAVISFKAARIGRDISESEELWNLCCDHGVHVMALDQEDLSDPLIRAIFFGQAAKGLKDRQDYSTASLERRRKRGLPPLKTCAAYGLRWAGDELAEEEDEFKVVKRIFESFDDGTSMGEIARQLSADGVPRRQTAHSQWDSSSVSRILRCTWYVGLLPDGPSHFDIGQTFIDPDLFDRVQARVSQMKRIGQWLDHPLSGVLFCGICGGWSPLSLCYSGGTKRRWRYRCVHHVRDRAFCPGQSIDCERGELLLLRALRDVIGEDELARARFARGKAEQVKAADARLEAIRGEINEVEAAQDGLFYRRDSGEIIPERIYNREMKQLERRLTSLNEDRRRLEEKQSLSRTAASRIQRELRGDDPLSDENWLALPEGRRNGFLRLLFPEGVTVLPFVEGAPRGSVEGRLVPRTAEENAAAEQRRSGLVVV